MKILLFDGHLFKNVEVEENMSENKGLLDSYFNIGDI